MAGRDDREPRPSLPTRSPPTAPPSTPTDSFAKVRVVGTVVADGRDGCVDVEDDSGVRWSLLGPGTDDLVAGDRVSATGQALAVPEGAGVDCTGAPVRVQKVTRTP